MKLAGVTVSQLEYLVAAATEPTWRDAAAAVGVTASALSQGISELERRLGVPLFEQRGRRRVPTLDALDAVTHARRILAEVRELTRWADEIRGGSSGQVSIGMIDTAAIHHFGDTLMQFRRTHPDLVVRLQVQPSNQLLEQLRAGELDAVVCVDPEPDDRLDLRPLLAEPLYIYAPPDVRVGRAERWGPWVSFPSDSRSRATIARAVRQQGASFDVVAESSQPAVIKEMVRLGMGWTVLSAVDAETGTHQLERARRTPIAKRTLTLVQRADRTPSTALASLLGQLQQAVDKPKRRG